MNDQTRRPRRQVPETRQPPPAAVRVRTHVRGGIVILDTTAGVRDPKPAGWMESLGGPIG